MKNAQQKKTNNSGRNKKNFIKAYPEWGTVGATMKAIGLKRRETFYDWLNADPAFRHIYETELLPNRRDECASLMYRYALGKLGNVTKTYTNKKGETWSEEVPVRLPDAQIRALVGFLKATDHVEKADDPARLVFCEKNQVELSTPEDKPLNLNATFRFVMPDGTEKTAGEMAHAGDG